jgi:hypothetical protein
MKVTRHNLLGPKDRELNSPVREGGVKATVICLSAEGAPRLVPALRAARLLRGGLPALTDGAINFRSFGPNACQFKTEQVPGNPGI